LKAVQQCQLYLNATTANLRSLQQFWHSTSWPACKTRPLPQQHPGQTPWQMVQKPTTPIVEPHVLHHQWLSLLLLPRPNTSNCFKSTTNKITAANTSDSLNAMSLSCFPSFLNHSPPLQGTLNRASL
jgi:hypothetical protein